MVDMSAARSPKNASADKTPAPAETPADDAVVETAEEVDASQTTKPSKKKDDVGAPTDVVDTAEPVAEPVAESVVESAAPDESSPAPSQADAPSEASPQPATTPAEGPATVKEALAAFAKAVLDAQGLERFCAPLDVEVLLPMLTDGRENVRANAARALALKGQFDAQLPRLLKDASAPVRLASADALASFGEAAADALIEAIPVLVEGDEAIRAKLVPTIASLYQTRAHDLRLALNVLPANAEKSILRVFEHLGEAGIPILEAALQDEVTLVRLNAVKALGILVARGFSVNLELALERTKDEIGDVREAAEKLLGALYSKSAPKKLGASRPLPTPDFHSRAYSAEELASLGKNLDADRMVAALDDGREQVRANAALALGVLGRPDERLVFLLKDSDGSVRLAAAHALGALSDKGATLLAKAIASIADTKGEVRAALLLAAKSLHGKNSRLLVEALRVKTDLAEQTILPVFDTLGDAARDLLFDALKDSSAQIRVNALIGLSRLVELNVAVDRRRVEPFTKDAVASVRDAAEVLLGKVLAKANKVETRPNVVLPFPEFDALLIDTDFLQKNVKKLDAEVLLHAIGDGRPTVRANAARALGVIKHATPLLPLLLKDTNENVRIAASEALAAIGDVGAPFLGRAIPMVSLVGAEARANLLQAFTSLIGQSDDVLLEALRVTTSEADRTILVVFDHFGADGLDVLYKALESSSMLIRLNGVRAIARLVSNYVGVDIGRVEPLTRDPVGDVRVVAEEVRGKVESLRCKVELAAALVFPFPEFELEELELASLKKQANVLSAEMMAQALSDGRRLIRVNACRALGALGAAPAKLALMLRDSEPAVRDAAAEALAELGPIAAPLAVSMASAVGDVSEAARTHLFTALRSPLGKHDDVLVETLRAPASDAEKNVLRFFDHAGADGVSVLIRALASKSMLIRLNAIYGLDRLVEARVKVDLVAVQALTNDPIGDVRRAAQAVCGAIFAKRRPPDTVAAAVLPTTTFATQVESIETLKKLGKSLDPAQLLQSMNDGRAMVRANSARALAAAGHATPRLVLQLRDTELVVGLAAAESLACFGVDAAPFVAQAVPLFDALRPEVLSVLLGAFQSFVGKADDVLIETLRVTVRQAEVSSLLIFDHLGAAGVPVLTKALGSDSGLVRTNAIHACNRLVNAGVAVDLEAVEAATHDAIAEVRETAGQVCALLFRRAKPQLIEFPPIEIDGFDREVLSFETLEKVKKRLELNRTLDALKDGRPAVRANAARALAVLEHGTPLLALSLRDADSDVVLAAAESLAKLGDHATPFLAGTAAVLQSIPAEARNTLLRSLVALAGRHDEVLIEALRVPTEFAEGGILLVFQTLGEKAVPILTRAIDDASVLIRLNGIYGFKKLVEANVPIDPEVIRRKTADPIGDVRSTAERLYGLLITPKRTQQLREAKSFPLEDFDSKVLDPETLEAAKLKLDAGMLAEALRDGRSAVRVNSARALGILAHQNPNAVHELAVLLRDEEEDVQLAAAWSLGRIAGEPAVVVPRLLQAMNGALGALRGVALDAILAFGDSALPLLRDALDNTDEFVFSTLIPVARRRDDKLAATFLEVLKDRKEPQRARANAASLLETIEATDDPEVFSAIERFRRARRPALRPGDSPPPERRAPLVAEPDPMPMPDFDVLPIEEAALNKAKASFDIALLERMLMDGRAVVRLNAASALGLLGSKANGAVPALAVRVRDSNPAVAIAAAKALAKLAYYPEHVVPAMANALRDAHRDVYGVLLDSIEAFGGVAAERLTLEIEKYPHRAFAVVRPVVNRMPKAFVAPLIDLLNSKKLKAQERAAELLLEIGPEAKKARDPLIACFYVKDGGLRVTAVNAIARIGDKDQKVISALRELQEKEPSKAVQYAVRRALIALGQDPEPLNAAPSESDE